MKKIFLSTIILLSLILSACGGSGGSGSSSGSGGKVDASGHVTLDFWYALSGSSGKAVEELVKRYNASQTGVTVVATYQGDYTSAMAKIYTAINGESVPNIVQVGGAPLLGASGQLLPVSDFLAKDSSLDLKQINPAFVEYNTTGGTLWCLPFNNSLPVLYYNKDLFTAAGLDPDKPPQNLDELLDVAQKLTQGGEQTGTPTQWGLNTRNDTHWYLSTLFLSSGASIVDPTQTQALYNSPQAVAMLQLWGDWVNQYKVMPANQHSEAQSDFLAGKLGMLLSSSADLSSFESSATFKVGTAVFPAVNGGHKIPVGGGSLAIFKNKDDRLVQASWDFAKFLVSRDSAIYLVSNTGYLPIYQDAFDWPEIQALVAKDPARAASIASLEYAVAIPVFSSLGDSDLALRTAIQSVELGAADAQKALDDAKVSTDRAIKREVATAAP